MEIKKFGTITEVDGKFLVTDFIFEGEGGYIAAFQAIADFFVKMAEESITQMPENKYSSFTTKVNQPTEMDKMEMLN